MIAIAPRWRKVVRDIWLSKTRTFLVVISIAVGVFAVGAVAGARTILARDLAAQYAATNDASGTISASNLDEQFVRSVARMPGVADAEGGSAATLRVPLGQTRSNLVIYTVYDYSNHRLDKFVYAQGKHVPGRRELLLERTSLALFNKHIGDTLTVELSDGKTRELTIAGTVFNVNAPPVQFSNFGVAYITPDTLEWLGYQRNFGRLRFLVSEDRTDRAHIQAIADQIKKRVEDSGRTFYDFSINQNPGQHYAYDQIQSMLLILVVLGALSLFLSAFLVINTTTAILTQQTRQIGIMKAIGAKTQHLTHMYLATVAAFGIVSLLIAVPLGAAGAQGLVGFVAGLLNFNVLTTATPPEVLALEIGVGLVVPLGAALVPISRGARITVHEAVSYTGLSESAKSTSLRRPERTTLSRLSAQFVSRPLLLSVRNTFRRTGRLVLTLGTLTLASAIFIAVFTVRDSLNNTLAASLRYWHYDIEVTLKNSHGEDKVLGEMLRVPGVVAAETWSSDYVRRVHADKTESRGFVVIAPPADTPLLTPLMVQGRWLRPDDTSAIVVSADVLADEPDIHVGDTVTLRFSPNRRLPFAVVGVTQSTLTGGVRNPRTVYINQAGYRKVLFVGRQIRTIEVVTEGHDAISRSETAKAIEAQFRAADMPVDTTETLSERGEQIVFQFNILIVFLLIMSVLLAVVGGLGLAGTMSINVLERTREIGVMRAIGASDHAVRGIVIAEGVFIGALSWLAGLGLAWPVSKALSDAVGMAFVRRTLDFQFSLTGAALWLVVVSIVAAISSLFPAWRAGRLTVREVLAYE